jgi:hypothetical protein
MQSAFGVGVMDAQNNMPMNPNLYDFKEEMHLRRSYIRGYVYEQAYQMDWRDGMKSIRNLQDQAERTQMKLERDDG